LATSTFSNITHAKNGGAIYLSYSVSNKPNSFPLLATHKINNSTFTSNTAQFGGAVLISDIDYVQISSSTFDSNTAIHDKEETNAGLGGAIAYTATGKL
jgi:hypothetical protein